MNTFNDTSLHQNILITGANGFIGSHLLAYLKLKGFRNVVGYDRDDLDLSDMGAVVTAIRDVKPDVIIDCAGITPHQNALPEDYNLNIQFMNNMVHAIRESNRDIALIYMSSVSVYGVPQSISGVVHEDDTLNPQSPYAQSKSVCERLVQNQDDMQSVIMRVANIVGKDAFINHVLHHNTAMLRGDVPFERDIVHVSDICTMVEKIMAMIGRDNTSEIFNCGVGHGYAFTDIINEIQEQTGQSINVTHAPLGHNDVVRLICDRQRATDILDWSPQYTKLDEIITAAIQYYEHHD